MLSLGKKSSKAELFFYEFITQDRLQLIATVNNGNGITSLSKQEEKWLFTSVLFSVLIFHYAQVKKNTGYSECLIRIVTVSMDRKIDFLE